MFIVTPQGVIATDPISENRPAADAYLAEIRKITQAPIRYVVYSHHDPDHIAGGKPFKDAGATFVAHRFAKGNIAADETRRHRAGRRDRRRQAYDQPRRHRSGTQLIGKNHTEDMLVMRLPRERMIFTVDWIPVRACMFQNMREFYVPEIEDGVKKVLAMDWDRMLPGHPGPGGRLGTKADVQNLISYLQRSFRRGEEGGRCRQVPGCGESRDQAAEIRVLDQLQQLSGGQYRALLQLLDYRAVRRS